MKYLEKEIRIRVSECDANSLWRPGAAMIEMQECAGEHSFHLGCGRGALLEQDLAWVVARMEIQIEKYPSYGDTVTMRTYHRPTRHWFFPRFFQVWDSRGELIWQASSLWLLMDLKTRQSVSGDRLPKKLPDNSDIPEPLPLPKGIAALTVPEQVIPYRTVYTDLDANGHVNNTKYADWLCNALGAESMKEHPLRSLTIHFNSEILPEQPVELKLRRDGLRYQLTGVHDGTNAFEMSGTLMEAPVRC